MIQPHRTQILWGLRQGSYPLVLYVWSVSRTLVRAFYQAQWQLYCNIVDSYDDFRAKISRNFLQVQNEFRCNKLKNKQIWLYDHYFLKTMKNRMNRAFWQTE